MKKFLLGFLILGTVSMFVEADTTTSRLGLTLPTIGSPTWGQKINTNFQILDATSTVVSGSLLVATGTTSGYTAVASSQTANLIFDTTQFNATLINGATVFTTIKAVPNLVTTTGTITTATISSASITNLTVTQSTITTLVAPSLTVTTGTLTTATISSGTVTNFTATQSTTTNLTATFANLGTLLGPLNANGFKITVPTATTTNAAPQFHQIGIIQVVSCLVTASSNTTTASFGNTPLTCSITPSTTSSNIGIFVSQPMFANTSAGVAIARIMRNPSTAVTGNCFMQYTNGAGTVNGSGGIMTGLDSPATTSSVTYQTQFKGLSGGSSVGVCDGSNSCDQRMWLFEINTQ